MSDIVSPTSQDVEKREPLSPRQAINNYKSSVNFMKQLTVIAVSTITYFKKFPIDSYTMEKYGDFELKILKKKCRDEVAQQVSSSLIRALEALDKKYLQKLAVCFYEGVCGADNLVDYYTFEYRYAREGVTLDVMYTDREELQQVTAQLYDTLSEHTTKLIQAYVVLFDSCQNEPPPPSYQISLRLYYNDAAPEGYQAPGFASCAETADHLERSGVVAGRTSKLGVVTTPFHRMVAVSYIREPADADLEPTPPLDRPVTTQKDRDRTNFADIYEHTNEAEESNSGIRVVCPCGLTDAGEDPTLLLTCEYCGRVQHAACYGVRAHPPLARRRHCCTHCSDTEPARTPTDPRVAALQPAERELVCRVRRALAWCGARRTVRVSELQRALRLPRHTALRLVGLLRAHGVLHYTTRDDIMSPMVVVTERFNELVNELFQEDSSSSLADRLVAERLQGLEDPVGPVLRPMEITNLRNEARIGKMIDRPTSDCAKEDATLKQYKEAIFSYERAEEELPLSGDHNPIKDMDLIGKGRKRKAKDFIFENKPTPMTKRAKAIRK